jgi:hypothetical protein
VWHAQLCAHTIAVLIFIREHAAILVSFGVVSALVWCGHRYGVLCYTKSSGFCCVVAAVLWEKAGCWQYMHLFIIYWIRSVYSSSGPCGVSVCGCVQGAVWGRPGAGRCLARATPHTACFLTECVRGQVTPVSLAVFVPYTCPALCRAALDDLRSPSHFVPATWLDVQH